MKKNSLLGAVIATAAVVGATNSAAATPFNILNATDLFVPSFRGDASTTWVGWDSFDDNGAGDMVINDATPDIGTDGGSFVTTNGAVHVSGSGNYYSGSTPIAEDIAFDTDGVDGSGTTTIIVQAKTLFGPFGITPIFSDLGGVSPTVVSGPNALGEDQLFAKYVIPGTGSQETFSISGAFPTGPGSFGSFVSFDQFVVDTYWSPTGPATDTAVASPEPTAALLSLLGLTAVGLRRRR